MTREKEIYKVTLVGSVGNVLLVIVKFIAGLVGHSSAMVADAVHSLSDFLTDVVVLVFVGVSARPQDASHDYGHGKFETLATLFISLALAGAAIGIIVSGAVKFSNWLNGAELPAPGKLALWVAVLSIVVKELMFRYTARNGRKLESAALVANAWHHRSDALSSVGAMAGIIGARMGLMICEPIASLVICVFIIKASVEIFSDAVGKMTDKACDESTQSSMRELILSQEGVQSLAELKTRMFGARVYVDVVITVNGELSLTCAHAIAEHVHDSVEREFPSVKHCMVHVDPSISK